MLPFAPLPSSRRGVTLIEVIIAIFVLSVGIVGIISLFPTGARLTRRAVERTVAGLAARHALARMTGRLNVIRPPRTDLEPLSSLADFQRMGVIFTVATNILTCRVPGNVSPAWTGGSLTNYFVVMTSGSADGHLYPITGNTPDTIATTARFNVLSTDREYEPVRVGDNFAIIGIRGTGYTTAPTKCFPDAFLGSLSAVSVPGSVDPELNETRTMPVATNGPLTQPMNQWRYSYGCILSAPPPGMTDSCRLDIFVYSGFPYRAGSDVSSVYPDPSVANRLMAGHFVSYIPAGKKTSP